MYTNHEKQVITPLIVGSFGLPFTL